ncbi:MAG: hypothetical protein IPN95_31290 [Bacteroidetes bacterium]|nr:hypothetical protein [Bacteroidota bacterium]
MKFLIGFPIGSIGTGYAAKCDDAVGGIDIACGRAGCGRAFTSGREQKHGKQQQATIQVNSLHCRSILDPKSVLITLLHPR